MLDEDVFWWEPVGRWAWGASAVHPCPALALKPTLAPVDVQDMSLVLSPPAIGQSRAVLRPVPAGNSAVCPTCGALVKFAARVRKQQVIANVYVDGRWARVEHFHPTCYAEAGEPHGAVIENLPPERRR